MDLRDSKYLKYDILAVSGDWLIVFDGKYNYMLFSSSRNEVFARYKNGWLPSNNVCSGAKYVEYYSTFDNAVKGLAKIVRNDGKFVSGIRYFRN